MIFVSAGFLLLGGLYVFRDIMIAPLLMRMLSEQAGRRGIELNIDSLSGNYLTALKGHGLHARGTTGLDAELTIRELTVRYPFFPLFRNAASLLADLSVEARGVRLDLKLPGDRSRNNRPLLLPPPRFLPRLTITDATCVLRGQRKHLHLEEAGLDIRPTDTRGRRIRIRSGRARLPLPGLTAGPVALELAFQYHRNLLTLLSGTINEQPVVQTATLDLSGHSLGRLHFTAGLRLFDGLVHIAGDLDQHRLKAFLDADGLHPGRRPDFLRPLPSWVSGSFRLRATVEADLGDSPTAEATAELQRIGKSLNGPGLSRLGLRGFLKDGSLHLREMEIHSEPADVMIKDAGLPLPRLHAGDIKGMLSAAHGNIRLTVRNATPILGLVMPARSPPALPEHSLTVTGKLHAGELTIQELKGRLGSNDFIVSRGRIPLEALIAFSPASFLREADLEFTFDGAGLPALLALIRPGREPPAKPPPEHTLYLTGVLESGRLVLSNGVFKTGSASVHLRQATIQPPPEEDAFRQTGILTDLSTEINDLSTIAAVFDLPVVRGGSLQGKIHLSGTLGNPEGRAAFTGRNLNLAGLRLETLAFEVLAADGLVRVQSLSGIRGLDRVTGRAVFRPADNFLESLQMEADISDTAPYLRLLPQPPVPLSGGIRASLRADGFLSDPRGRLEIVLDSGGVGPVPVETATVSLNYAGHRLEAEDLRITTPYGGLTLTAAWEERAGDNRYHIDLAALSLTPGNSRFSLARPTAITYEPATGSWLFQPLVLTGGAGSCRLAGILAPAGASELHLSINNLTGTGWLEEISDRRLYFHGLDGRLRFTGTFADPQLMVSGTVAELGGPDAPHPFKGDFDVLLTADGIRLDRFHWAGPAGQRISLTGRLPLAADRKNPFSTGDLHLSGRLDIPDLTAVTPLLPEDYPAGGRLTADFKLAGTWKRPAGHVHLLARGLAPPPSPDFLPPGPYGIDCDITFAEGSFILEKLGVVAPEFQGRVTGSWHDAPSLATLFRGEEWRDTGRLNLTGDFSVPDIQWVATRFDNIRRLAGSLSGEFSLTGQPGRPHPAGRIILSGGELRTPGKLPPINRLNLTAKLTPGTVNITEGGGELGGSPFTLQGMFKHDENGGFQVDLALRGDNLLLYRRQGVIVRGNAGLRINGLADGPTVTGVVRLTEGRYGRDYDFLGLLQGGRSSKDSSFLRNVSFSDPPFRDMRFDVQINAEKPFMIKNNLATGLLEPALRVQGSGEIPVLTGEIYIRDARFNLPAGRINLEAGLIRFPENNPDRPLLDLRGSSRLQGYDVTVLINGPLDEPVITLSSVPPLPDDQLLLLVLTGKAPQSPFGGTTARRGGMKVALYLGRDLLARLFDNTEAEPDESVLERFDLALGRGQTRSGEETVEARFLLAEDVLRRNDALYLTAERDIYDDYHAGVKIVFRFQ